jgi:hypothetical protein
LFLNLKKDFMTVVGNCNLHHKIKEKIKQLNWQKLNYSKFKMLAPSAPK